MSKLKQLLEYFNDNPRDLFKVDGIGAIFSAVLLGIVLVRLESFFGIPSSTLYFLASIPIIFAIYDYFCYKMVTNKVSAFLKGIALANTVYCFISLGFACFHYQVITCFGWIYIIGEISVLILLINIELKVANALNRNATN